MKKFTLLLFVTLVSFHIKAQSVDLRRKVEVTGTAEQEVTPDIIHVNISLKEYIDGKNKVGISELESQLEQAVKDAGIAKDALTLSSISSWNITLQKKKNPDFLASKQYDLKCSDLNKFDQLIGKIDPKGIQSTYISRYEYSKMDQLKNELRLKALMSAKEQASASVNALGQKLGRPISINEYDNNSNYALNEVVINRKVAMDAETIPASDVSIKKIKVRLQEHVVFEIID